MISTPAFAVLAPARGAAGRVSETSPDRGASWTGARPVFLGRYILEKSRMGTKTTEKVLTTPEMLRPA